MPDVRSAENVRMWVGTQAALRLTVIGIGLVAAAVHGTAGAGRGGPAAAAPDVAAVADYTPPATSLALAAAPHTQARVLRLPARMTHPKVVRHRPAAAPVEVRAVQRSRPKATATPAFFDAGSAPIVRSVMTPTCVRTPVWTQRGSAAIGRFRRECSCA
jgi:hypothetical protein